MRSSKSIVSLLSWLHVQAGLAIVMKGSGAMFRNTAGFKSGAVYDVQMLPRNEFRTPEAGPWR